jgi:crotonobetainyl-CoA:carnitine CoA-transferase CaiB-like acyl-CoA transferase
MPYTDGHWHEFTLLIGDADLANDPMFMTMKGRQANIERVRAEVGRQLLYRTNAEWLTLCATSDIPVAVVNSLEDLLDDPHLESVGFCRLMEHWTERTLRFPANPLELSATPPSIRRPPPLLGEHTTEVLREFGCAV